MSKQRIVVISDLHIGAGLLDDCDRELEDNLISFLRALSSDSSETELVINGDFLDFVQAAPWTGRRFESLSPGGVELCYTEEQSLEKLEAIAKAHRPIFDALQRFLASAPGNTITILPGNHDADFFWPRVRSLFIEEACGRDNDSKRRVNFHLEKVYRPALMPGVWIEHGNQYDPINWFYVKEIDAASGTYKNPELYWSAKRPPIFKDADGTERLYECLGTRFLIKFINALDADYPFVDNVKPFSRFLKIFGSSALIPGFGPLRAAAAAWGMLKFLADRVAGNPGDLLNIRDVQDSGPYGIISNLLDTMSLEEKRSFKQALAERGFQFYGSLDRYVEDSETGRENAEKLLYFLSENLDITEGLQSVSESLLGAPGSGTLSLAGGFTVDETEELKKAAKDVLYNSDANIVIMGHTHEPVDDARYINTGSWTRYYKFANEEKTRPWSLLKAKSFENFPYELNYAEIVPGRDVPVQRKTYRPS